MALAMFQSIELLYASCKIRNFEKNLNIAWHLKSFESINSHIHEIKNPSPKPNISQQIYEQDHKPQPNNDLDLDF